MQLHLTSQVREFMPCYLYYYLGFIINQSQLYPKDIQYFISSEQYSFPDVKLMTVKPGFNRSQAFKQSKLVNVGSAAFSLD